MALEYDIPELVTSAEREIPSAKPGSVSPPPRFSDSPYIVRWTRYGMWTDDGLTVLNEHGQAIYRSRELRYRPSKPGCRVRL